MYKIILDNYEILNTDGAISVLKNGKPDDIRNKRYLGDKVILLMLHKIEELASRPSCGKEHRVILFERMDEL